MNSGKALGRLVARNVIARRNYGGGHHHKPATMNDLPTPAGDFFQWNAARQRGHNTVLAIGLVMFSSTIWLVKESNLIHLNYSPPDTYE